MKLIVVAFIILVALLLDTNGNLAPSCNQKLCQLPDCRCSTTDIPGNLRPEDIPQFVLLTFDDAVTVTNYPYYKVAFDNRTNPNGCPIAATYFVSHEYTDYTLVMF